jgi:predicted GNAT family acetyltransferase
MPDPDVQIVNNAEKSRYEVLMDGALAGFSTYRLQPGDRVVVLHTEIDDAFEHHGLGSKLAEGLLDDIRRQGLKVVPRCPFIAKYVREHPEYEDLRA